VLVIDKVPEEVIVILVPDLSAGVRNPGTIHDKIFKGTTV
jgi:hypothetical protein